jgi:glycosyltransferase involved in cell wall biosynthesis
MQEPFVSVIIPTYNDWDRLALCLGALEKQTYPKERFEVIVVNNHPDDSIPASFTIPDGFRVLTEKKSGSYAARNAGLLQSKGDILGFTDSDCIPSLNWIKSAVDYFNTNKKCSRIAGKVEFYFKHEKPNDVELLEALFSFNQNYYVTKHGMGATANMFSYKNVFDAIGGFNAEMMSGGDLEWGKRAKAAGYNIDYVTTVIVKHPARSTYKELKSKARRVAGGHSQIALARKPTKFQLAWILMKSLKPKLKETIFIYRQKKIGIVKKTKIFLMCYQLQVIRALEKFKVSMGKKPQRS